MLNPADDYMLMAGGCTGRHLWLQGIPFTVAMLLCPLEQCQRSHTMPSQKVCGHRECREALERGALFSLKPQLAFWVLHRKAGLTGCKLLQPGVLVPLNSSTAPCLCCGRTSLSRSSCTSASASCSSPPDSDTAWQQAPNATAGGGCAGDDVIVLAEDDDTYEPALEPPPTGKSPVAQSGLRRVHCG